MATEAVWLNGKKERRTHGKSETLLTGAGLLMEGVDGSPAASILLAVPPRGRDKVSAAKIHFGFSSVDRGATDAT